jgi:lipopolysaccharide biosynthesis glycosyltransferase
MKKIIYQVYIGKRSKLYDHCTDSVKAYAKRIGADYELQRTPILMIKPDVFMTNRSKESYEKHGGFLPIYEKENAFAYLKSYDQVAIIDADVYIRDDAANIFDDLPGDYDFGAVLERDMPITSQYKQKIANYSKMQYGMSPLNNLFTWNESGADFYNMGIMVLNKSFNKYLNGETPMQFLRRPRFKVFIDGMGTWKWSTDQTLLNVFVKEEKLRVKNMDWRWNGLYTANTKIRDCHFVHFFLKDKLPSAGENVEELMKNV